MVLGVILLGVAFALDSFTVLLADIGVLVFVSSIGALLPISAAVMTSSTTVSVSSLLCLLSFSGTYRGACGTFGPLMLLLLLFFSAA